MIHTSSPRHTLPSAEEMAFGIVVAEPHEEIAGLLLEGAARTLRETGCLEHNLQIRYVPSLLDLPMATQFLAEYTDVDAVILVGCTLRDEPAAALLPTLLQQCLSVQMHWNMPCIWSVLEGETPKELFEQHDRAITAATEAVRMVRMQIDMEAHSPNAAPADRSLN